MWFTKEIDNTLQELQVNAAVGLSDAEAIARLEKNGPNKLQGKKKATIFQLFFAQLNDALIYVLFAAVLITVFMGEYVDAVIILLVIAINAILGVVQEIKAGNAIEALRNLTTPKALVKRNGEVKEILSDDIVVGDIVVLDTGRFVAADLRLIESVNLQIDESALTGESVPSAKHAQEVLQNEQASLGDRVNSAFMSTLVTYGRGLGVVVETGMKTEVGKIADIIDNEAESKTPLEKRLDELGKSLGFIAIGICVLIFILAYFQHRNLTEMLLTAVSLAVASIPEGLAAIVAVVLSIGVTVMSKKNAIIKKLPAVETLGSVNIVCSDKTGTLTQNRMTVTCYFNSSEAEVLVDKQKRYSADAEMLARAMILCSDATFENGAGTGDPTEIALLVFGDTLNMSRKELAGKNLRVGEFAFDSDRKLMSTLVDSGGSLQVFTKGAIDNLINICTRVFENGQIVQLTEAHKIKYSQATELLSSRALRTLAAAFKPVDGLIASDEMENDLVLLGMVGMIDPPREEVKSAIKIAKQAGISTIMITGDHKNTAFAIAKDLGIAERIEQVILGDVLQNYKEQELADNINSYKVFARVSPEHKVNIVRAFKSQGNIVSMTGDGVNDAPSLHSADIGVAMGITGTDVAKNAADMILTDDNFSTIIAAIEQGRNIYNNIKKSVVFLLASNTGEVISMVICILIGIPAPLIATQLLWINLITDSLPAVALGMDPGDPDVMQQKPRNPKESFFAHGAALSVITGGVLIGLLTIVAFWYGFYHHGYSPLEKNIPINVLEFARTLAFLTIISCQLFYSMTFRNHTKSIFTVGIFTNKYLIGAIIVGLLLQLIVLIIPFFRTAFKLQPLDAEAWVAVILLGFVPVLFNEIKKIYLRSKAKH